MKEIIFDFLCVGKPVKAFSLNPEVWMTLLWPLTECVLKELYLCFASLGRMGRASSLKSLLFVPVLVIWLESGDAGICNVGFWMNRLRLMKDWCAVMFCSCLREYILLQKIPCHTQSGCFILEKSVLLFMTILMQISKLNIGKWWNREE